MRIPNRVTQNQVGAGGGFGGRATSAAARKYWDQIPTRVEVDRGYPHSLHYRLQIISGLGREQAPG